LERSTGNHLEGMKQKEKNFFKDEKQREKNVFKDENKEKRMFSKMRKE